MITVSAVNAIKNTAGIKLETLSEMHSQYEYCSFNLNIIITKTFLSVYQLLTKLLIIYQCQCI